MKNSLVEKDQENLITLQKGGRFFRIDFRGCLSGISPKTFPPVLVGNKDMANIFTSFWKLEIHNYYTKSLVVVLYFPPGDFLRSEVLRNNYIYIPSPDYKNIIRGYPLEWYYPRVSAELDRTEVTELFKEHRHINSMSTEVGDRDIGFITIKPSGKIEVINFYEKPKNILDYNNYLTHLSRSTKLYLIKQILAKELYYGKKWRTKEYSFSD